MPPKLVAFDMDGTLVDVESSWAEVHRYFHDSNKQALQLFMEDKIDDREFIRRDIEIWWRHDPDLTVEKLDRILADVPLMPGAEELFAALGRAGVETAIISGGIDLLAERIGRRLGIPHVYANGFVTDGAGRLTGGSVIRVPIKDKGSVMRRLQQELGVDREGSAAVGNSDIDVGMFRECGRGVAFLPADDTVRAGATHVVTAHDLSECIGPLLGE